MQENYDHGLPKETEVFSLAAIILNLCLILSWVSFCKMPLFHRRVYQKMQKKCVHFLKQDNCEVLDAL